MKEYGIVSPQVQVRFKNIPDSTRLALIDSGVNRNIISGKLIKEWNI